MIDQEQRNSWAKAFAKQICEAWGWLEDEPEALVLGMNIAYNLEVLVAGTRTSPEALVQALLPLTAVPQGQNAPMGVGVSKTIQIQEVRGAF